MIVGFDPGGNSPIPHQAVVTIRIERADKRALTVVAPLDIQLAEDPIAFKAFAEKVLRDAWDKQEREG